MPEQVAMERAVGGQQVIAEHGDDGPGLAHIAERRGVRRESVHPRFEPIAQDGERLLSGFAPQFDRFEQGVDGAEELGIGGAAGEVEISDGFFKQRQLFFGGFRGWLDHRNGAYLE